jgi:hypothetical protein
MGIDFIRKCAPAFRKGLDRRRVELGTPDLFSRKLERKPRAYAASVQSGERLAEGDKLSVCLKGNQVLALRGLSPVAQIRNPPTELVMGLQASFGEACGEVQSVHEMACIAEITLC